MAQQANGCFALKSSGATADVKSQEEEEVEVEVAGGMDPNMFHESEKDDAGALNQPDIATLDSRQR